MNIKELSEFVESEMNARTPRLTEPALAKMSGVSQSTIHRIVAGETKDPGYFTVLKIARALELNIESVAGLSEPPSSHGEFEGYTLVPRYDIQAGMGRGEHIYSEQIVDHLAFKQDWLRSQGIGTKAACVAARGDSMEPTIGDGSICLIDLSQTSEDGIYAMSRPSSGDSYEVIVKRIERRMDGSTRILSDNKKYEPEILDSGFDLAQLSIIGRVVWVGGTVY